MRRALVVVDVQNDFLPGGALAVPDGDAVIEVVNRLLREGRFDLRVATRDLHPVGHASFASSHPGRCPYDTLDLDGVRQVLWPDHCVDGTLGSELALSLDRDRFDHVVEKGTDRRVDSYSGFFDAAQKRTTGLSDCLLTHGIQCLVVLGLATDYCVKATALDALSLGFHVTIAIDGCRGVELNHGDEARALHELEREGATLATSEQILRDG